MATSRQIIRMLNDVLAAERRQALVYRHCAAMLTGPYRESLSEEFKDHADDEDEHAETVMLHIVALGGDIESDIKPMPMWHTLDEALNGIEELEKEGILAWQELLGMLPESDSFRYVVETALDKETEHYDEVRRWKRTDYAEKSMKPLGDYGSNVPLNLRQRQIPEAYVVKSASHDERMWSESRAGTPPTRRGMLQGTMPLLSPGRSPALNPALYLGKAVIDPSAAGSGAFDATPRKRDPKTGKFTEAPASGQQSSAEDDASAAAGVAHLAAKRVASKAFGDDAAAGGPPQLARPKPATMGEQAGIPGAPPGAGSPMDGQMDAGASGAPIGTTPDGAPVYDDPYHPSHSQFSPDQHQAAAQMHTQQAEMASSSGRIPTALDHQLKARIHGDLANDSKSPMERVLARQGMPGATENDPMDDFLTQLPDQQPGAQNAMSPNQNKPLGGDQTQGPLPRMMNTDTGTPVGPQSQSMQHAGTVSQPQGMPPEPSDGSSMPGIQGEPGYTNLDDQMEPSMPPDADPETWDPTAPQEQPVADENPANTAPDSNAGAFSNVTDLAEKDMQPTPGGSESEPPTMGAGPTTDDSPADQMDAGDQGDNSGSQYDSSTDDNGPEYDFSDDGGADVNDGGDTDGAEPVDNGVVAEQPTGAPGAVPSRKEEEMALKSFQSWVSSI